MDFMIRHKRGLIVGAIALVLIGVAVYFGVYLDTSSRIFRWFTRVLFVRGFFPSLNPLHWTKWVWLLAGLIILAVGLLIKPGKKKLVVDNSSIYERQFTDLPAQKSEVSDEQRVSLKKLSRLWVCVGLALLLLSSVVWAFAFNDHSAGYASRTTFVVEDINKLPSSLKLLGDNSQKDKHGCQLYAHKGMRGCIKQGSFDFDFENRISSATGANKIIGRTGASVQKTQYLSDTLSYLYPPNGKGAWSGIRDGKGVRPIYGVTVYDDDGNIHNCYFNGANLANKAFTGRWLHNLSDKIVGQYPGLFYDSADRYGFCNADDQAVIVIPVKKQISTHTRTAFRSSGVLEITGSPSGKMIIRHVTDIKVGQYPGPVYPASLAKEQRESMGMIAGIYNSIFKSFGYEETDVETQSGNASEYQLRDKNTGVVYWVTPMRARSSDSQVLSAYSLTRADVATDGRLNEQLIYVLPDDDPRAANLDDLEARTKEALSRTDPGFYPAGGKLVEFLPLNSQQWQVYGEFNGRVSYRIVVPTNSRVRATVYEVTSEEDPTAQPSGSTPQPSGAATPPGGTSSVSVCTEQLDRLSDSDLARCLEDVAKEFQSRNKDK